MNSTTITVPLDQMALLAAAAFFTTLAEQYGSQSRPYCSVKPKQDFTRVSADEPDVSPLQPVEEQHIYGVTTGQLSGPAQPQTMSAPAMPSVPPQTMSAPAMPSVPPQTIVHDDPVPPPPKNFGIDSAYDEPDEVTPDGSTVDTSELDPEGIPWDPRIHSSSMARLARGNYWKLMRGVDPALVMKVKAELKAKYAPVAPAPVAPALAPVAPALAPVAPALAPVAPVAPAPAPAPAAPVGAMTPQQLIQKVAVARSSGKLTQLQINAALNTYKLSSIGMILIGPNDETKQATIAGLAAAMGVA